MTYLITDGNEPILHTKIKGAKVRRPGLWVHVFLNLATQSLASTSPAKSHFPHRPLSPLIAKKKGRFRPCVHF